MFVGQPLAYDSGNDHLEAVSIIDWDYAIAAIVETERLLIQVPEQMKRLNRNVSTANGSICERPEVLKAIGVNSSAHVLNSMIDNLVSVIRFKAIVRKQRIGIKSRT